MDDRTLHQAAYELASHRDRGLISGADGAAMIATGEDRGAAAQLVRTNRAGGFRSRGDRAREPLSP